MGLSKETGVRLIQVDHEWFDKELGEEERSTFWAVESSLSYSWRPLPDPAAEEVPDWNHAFNSAAYVIEGGGRVSIGTLEDIAGYRKLLDAIEADINSREAEKAGK